MLAAFVGVLLLSVSLTLAQPGGGKKDKKGGFGKGNAETATEFVNRMMAFNKAKDGKLTKEELTDSRLHFLFERADANKDGVVTREELEALYTRESAQDAGKGDKGGFGDKGDKGKGDKCFGKGDKGFGKGKGPQIGTVLPDFVQDALNLTDAQRKDLTDLQKDVDSRLEKILNDDQRKMLRDMRNFGGGPAFGDKKKGPGGDKKGPPPGD